MKPIHFFSSSALMVELGQNKLCVLNGDHGFEIPLERLDSGRLAPGCRDQLVDSLTQFVRQQPWRLRQRAFCALGARGVSLRQLTLPKAPDDELRRLLRLQMESEFPLPPDALAWGYCRSNRRAQNGTPGQEVIVAALKREVIQEYAEIFQEAGLTPVFTLAAWARSSICPSSPQNFGLLEISRCQTEFVSVNDQVVTGMRVLPWGEDDLFRSLTEKLDLQRAQAEQKLQEASRSGSTGSNRELENALTESIQALAGAIGKKHGFSVLYVTMESGYLDAILPRLQTELGCRCDRISIPVGPGYSAATFGLQRLRDANGSFPHLSLEEEETAGRRGAAKSAGWQWAAFAGLLLLASLSLRYAEPVLYRTRLSRRLAEIKGYRDGIPRIERELSFLQYFTENQPPLLDALCAIANAAPPGTRLDAVSMNRRGEVSLRGVMSNPQQAADFRGKLVDSGFFASVVLDEQTPSPDRQRVQFRMSAQWKPNGQRPRISPEPGSGQEHRTNPQPVPVGPSASNASPGPNPSRGAASPPGTDSIKPASPVSGPKVDGSNLPPTAAGTAARPLNPMETR